MKRLFALAALLFCPALIMAQVIPNASAPATPANQSTKLKFTQDGAFANVNFASNNSGSSVISLSVASGTGTSDSLQYSAVTESADFNTLTITNEFGTIPGSAFTGQNTQNLALSIDTSTLDPSAFFTESCTIIFNPISVTCGPGTTGQISLSWRENDAVSTTTNDHTKTTVGTVTTISNQHSDNSTANVTGTIYGTDVSGASAQVGVNHMSTIQVMR